MRFLVTASNTREKIDDVRDWGNIFTGNTGFSIAKAIAQHGEVDLLTSNRSHLAEIDADPSLARSIHGSSFTSHAELKAALAALLARQGYDAIFMTAAVADYRPAGAFAVLDRKPLGEGRESWTVQDVQAGKIKSTHAELAFLGRPTEKIVDLFRTEWNHRGLLVKFKLEVGIGRDELIRVAEASRIASKADYLVANTLDMVRQEPAGAFLLGPAGHEWVPRPQLPARMAALVAPSR